MSFYLLIKYCRGLWLKKAEAKSLSLNPIVLVYAAKFVWSSSDKPSTCTSLKPISKNRQDEIKFTFDVMKCERIFDELTKLGKIKFSHTIPSTDELKRRAYCKLQNTFSQATNDCNVLHRQIQSATNEGQLVVPAMQVNQNPFSVHTLSKSKSIEKGKM